MQNDLFNCPRCSSIMFHLNKQKQVICARCGHDTEANWKPKDTRPEGVAVGSLPPGTRIESRTHRGKFGNTGPKDRRGCVLVHWDNKPSSTLKFSTRVLVSTEHFL